MTSKRIAMSLVSLLLLFMVWLPLSAQQHSALGQSSTILPDGRILLAGGLDSSSNVTSSAAIVAADGTATPLSVGMKFARAGHTATVLPDGTVFIFGGVDNNGKIVTTAERFDPATQTFSVVPDVFAVPRAFHTATLLTDGAILFAGGVLAGGEFPDDVQLFDYRKNAALSQHAVLSFPREGHSAELLSDGTVRMSGGTDRFGQAVTVREIYDPVSKRFRFANDSTLQSDADAAAPVTIAASIPEDGATDVAIQDPVAFRFTHLLDYRTATAANFSLLDPQETAVRCTVTAAENGRLVFVLPAEPLQPGTTYALRIRNVADKSGQLLPDTSITFTTAGEPPESDGPDWIPGPGWTTGTGGSKWQELAPLQAAPGVTALAGQVLKLNGWPLQHVTLEIDGKRAHTDSTGRFLLRGLPAGHHVLWIDASTANHGNFAYGTYEVGVTILANRTNALNYTIWMTKLDMAHAINIPSPTTQETVLTSPSLPGLELHLPPDTTITDRNGRVVHQVSITPVPLDKPPFPLPAGVKVPIYFTVQPGGAYISVGGSKDGPRGARLIYPNGFHLRPGTPFDFWNYDADAKGWYIYGSGKVSPDGKNIVPDPGVVIYEFTGAMVGGSGVAPGKGKPVKSKAKAADPVDLSTGEFIYTKTDLVLPDVVPINFTRTYITNDSRSRAFGIGATDSYDFFMVGDSFPYTFQELIQPDGGRVRFDRVSGGSNYTDAVYVATTAPGPFYGAVLSWNSDASLPGAWKIAMKDGTVLSFPDSLTSTSPFCQAVIQIKDRYGNVTRIDRDANCLLQKITSPNGRYITVTNDTSSRISQIMDNSGRTVVYTYDAAGQLHTVTDPNNGVTTYAYDAQNRMTTITDARGIPYLTNHYDGGGRVIQQDQADGGTYLFTWTPSQSAQTHFNHSFTLTAGGVTDGAGQEMLNLGPCWGGGYNRYDPNCTEGYLPLVGQVDVTDPRGYVRRVVFGDTGYMTSDTHALGQPEEQTVTYSYYADNLLQSVTDPLGRVTSFDYDSQGNTTRITRLDGTPNAVTTTMSYGGPFGQLSSITDALGHTSTFSYDAAGNRIRATDSLGHQTTFGYNPAGELTSLTDSVNHTAQFGYFGGDLTTKIDPLGNVTTEFRDAVGRVGAVTDALGQTARFQYDVLNRVQQITDPQGNVSSYSYDPNGNPLSITDANGHTTTYTYDNMDRRATRTDPLLRQETYTYDLNGNIATVTDRKGQVTAFMYDPLNRLVSTCFNQTINAGVTSCESSTSYQYDLVNRQTIITDSVGGVITETFDDLGRLVNETNPQGSVSYTYDAVGRVATKTIAGQTPFTYTYNASQLLSITQGAQSVVFTYDSAGRPATVTWPNGMVATYTYDAGSHLSEIAYSLNQVTIGNLTYTYDALNRRAGVGGSLAATALPLALTSATYDAANQLATWNGTAFSYDANGSLVSDGQNTYTWNARGQLSGISGGLNASFTYDAFGRRVAKAVGANVLSFVYDGGGVAQELTGSTVTASIWSGGSNGFVQRTDSSGTVVPLTDAQGSVIALADSSGNLLTQYYYDPFGNTVAGGLSSSNEFQYIGRENDFNGLYYMHARYYSPAIGRFISEDPLGFGGGDVNFYAYVGDSPTNFIDPTGLSRECPVPSLCGDSPGGAQSLAGRKDRWWSDFWRAFWYGSSGPHGCDIATGKPLPGSEALCDDSGHFVGEAPGAISANAMNGAIIFAGGGLLTGAAGGEASLGDIANPIIDNAGPFECDACAAQLGEAFQSSGYDVTVVEITGGPFDELSMGGQTISTSGYHVGVEVEGRIFDNISRGVPSREWVNSISSSGSTPLQVTRIPFNQWGGPPF